MKLYNYLDPSLIKLNCLAKNGIEVLQEMLEFLLEKNKISDPNIILKKLLEREKLGSTSIGYHSAVPHAKIKEIKEPVFSIGISQDGLVYHESDKELVHLIILIISPNTFPIKHLQILAAAASLVRKSGNLINEVLKTESPHHLIEILKRYETKDD